VVCELQVDGRLALLSVVSSSSSFDASFGAKSLGRFRAVIRSAGFPRLADVHAVFASLSFNHCCLRIFIIQPLLSSHLYHSTIVVFASSSFNNCCLRIFIIQPLLSSHLHHSTIVVFASLSFNHCCLRIFIIQPLLSSHLHHSTIVVFASSSFNHCCLPPGGLGRVLWGVLVFICRHSRGLKTYNYPSRTLFSSSYLLPAVKRVSSP
jgi:hypothetical protein